VVSLVLPVCSPVGGWGFESHELHNTILLNTGEPTRGCHVVAHDWATWHLHNQSNTATCQTLVCTLVCHVPSLSACHCTYHVSLLTSFRATCHPYNGDTCHPQTGPTHLLYALSSTTCHLQMLPHHLYGCMACIVSLPRGLYSPYNHPLFLPICVFDHNAISFAYKARLTK
jgi:hypothetical protein